MFTINRRLLAVAFIAALALAQVVPASAGDTTLTYGSCSGNGHSQQGSPSYGSTYVSPSCGYQYLRLYYFNGSYYVPRTPMDGSYFFYFDSVPQSTPVYSEHRIGTSYNGGLYLTYWSYS